MVAQVIAPFCVTDALVGIRNSCVPEWVPNTPSGGHACSLHAPFLLVTRTPWGNVGRPFGHLDICELGYHDFHLAHPHSC